MTLQERGRVPRPAESQARRRRLQWPKSEEGFDVSLTVGDLSTCADLLRFLRLCSRCVCSWLSPAVTFCDFCASAREASVAGFYQLPCFLMSRRSGCLL